MRQTQADCWDCNRDDPRPLASRTPQAEFGTHERTASFEGCFQSPEHPCRRPPGPRLQVPHSRLWQWTGHHREDHAELGLKGRGAGMGMGRPRWEGGAGGRERNRVQAVAQRRRVPRLCPQPLPSRSRQGAGPRVPAGLTCRVCESFTKSLCTCSLTSSSVCSRCALFFSSNTSCSAAVCECSPP